MSKERSHEQFLEVFEKRQPLLFNKLYIIDKYTFNTTRILVKDKYGICLVSPKGLLDGKNPTLESAIDKTLYFSNMLIEVNPNFFNEFELIEKYEKYNKYILIRTKYGICRTKPNRLLDNFKPTIQTAVNKNEYFVNQLLEKNPKFFNDFTLISDFISTKKPIRVQNKYGVCGIIPNSLLMGNLPDIQLAINKTEYWINMAKEIHGDRYDYSLVNYIRCDSKIKIICKEHGIFKQIPNNHLRPQHCPICAENIRVGFTHKKWKDSGLKSKNFVAFQCYIIRCWNDTEEFYKIGKTFVNLKRRYGCKSTMPYNYEIVKIIEGDGEEISKLEHSLHLSHKNYKYSPLVKFPGSKKECVSKLDIEHLL